MFIHRLLGHNIYFQLLMNNVKKEPVKSLKCPCLLLLQVFGAIRQAVQHAPQYPECHNLNGLVCEAHADYQSAAACFRLARCALTKFSDIIPKSHSKDISINLARSLCRVRI